MERGELDKLAEDLANNRPNNLVNNGILNLSSCDLDHEGAIVVAGALEKNTTVTTLHLEVNGIESEGAKAIAKSLIKNARDSEREETVTTLDLSDNPIGAEGAEAIGKLLRFSKKLDDLSLAHTGICTGGKTEGLKAIGDGLSVNKTLSSLDIANNEINAGGIDYICKALGRNTTLKRIDFSLNPIGILGLSAIRNVLKANRGKTAITEMLMLQTNPDRSQETAYQQNLVTLVSTVPSIIHLHYQIAIQGVRSAINKNKTKKKVLVNSKSHRRP